MTVQQNNTRALYVYYIAFFINITLILNYLVWAVAAPSQVVAVFIIACLLLLYLSVGSRIKTAWPIFLFILFGFAVTLGTETFHWDTRSIWLFHGKRIFTDGTLYATMDNYAAFSHNDYPALYPALSATAAKAVGVWNEVFPKSVVCFLYIPALLILCKK